MAKPQHISDKAEFEKILGSAGSKLVVVDFYAGIIYYRLNVPI